MTAVTSQADLVRPRRFRSSPLARRFARNRVAVASLAVVVVLLFVAAFPNVLMSDDPNVQDITNRMQRPSADAWLGTDALGRDIWSRLVAGTRVTIFASLVALCVSVLLGIPAGLVAGYAGRVADSIMSRIADGLLAIPPIFLALAIVGAFGTGLTTAMIAVGVVLAPRFFRIARAAAQSSRKETYIEACRADGFTSRRILARHILPNAAGPLLVQVSFSIGVIVSAEASLSFLGLAVQLPQSSWGGMTLEAFNVAREDWWPLLPSTAIIVITVTAFFVIGDALRDAIGPMQEET